MTLRLSDKKAGASIAHKEMFISLHVHGGANFQDYVPAMVAKADGVEFFHPTGKDAAPASTGRFVMVAADDAGRPVRILVQIRQPKKSFIREAA